jgi:hypothetical protein
VKLLVVTMNEMTLPEIKRAARERRFSKIKSDSETVWHDIENWPGWDPTSEDTVYYYLEPNRIRVKNALNPREHHCYALR